MFLPALFRLSSENLLVLPKFKLSTVDGRAFSISLAPKHPRRSSLQTFKTELKTNLFTACLVNIFFLSLSDPYLCWLLSCLLYDLRLSACSLCWFLIVHLCYLSYLSTLCKVSFLKRRYINKTYYYSFCLHTQNIDFRVKRTAFA